MATVWVYDSNFFWLSDSNYYAYISDALHDLVPFVQFWKSEKQPWRSDTFSKVASFDLQLY